MQEVNKINQFSSFQEAVNTLKPISPKNGINDYYDPWSQDEFDETLEDLKNSIKFVNAFYSFFNESDLLIEKYAFDKNEQFLQLAQSYANAKGFENGIPAECFSQTNAEDNNNLNNFYYYLTEDINKFLEYSKDKITNIEILAMPKILAQFYEQNEKE